MTPTPDQIADYLQKIGFKGEPSVSLDCLIKMVEGHAFAFPFETLSLHDSVLDHRPDHRTTLHFNALHRKLVLQGRGGRCVELNTLLQTMLKAVGFSVKPILGEDLFSGSHIPKRERSKHSAGIVTLHDEKFLIDAAFGGLGIIAPIPLKPGEFQHYSEKFKLVKSDEYAFVLQMCRNGQFKDLYGFDHTAAKKSDFNAVNKKNANVLNATSLFKTFFSCTKPFKINHDQNGRHTICNDKFTIRENNITVHRETIQDQERLHQILGDYFNIALSSHYLRYDETAMLAYQQGIHYPPTLHCYNTRLQKRYRNIQNEVIAEIADPIPKIERAACKL